MYVHLVNPSHLAFGVAVITPRWLYVLATATPSEYGDPIITDDHLVARGQLTHRSKEGPRGGNVAQ